jgi:sarcosine oxidase subunit alpha
MEVNGVPNVRTCIIPVEEGMQVKPQSKAEVSSDATFQHPIFRDVPVVEKDFVIVGGGPAGLSAALYAKKYGISPLIVEENFLMGGQLIKQTHKFFGSRSHYAGIRGIDIAQILIKDLQKEEIETWTSSSVIGYYPDNILGVVKEGRYIKVKAKAILIATGASEKMVPFLGNDLPGVYGAGAIQTLTNVYGIAPGQRVIMVGAGNIGVIVAYQLLQANIDVAAVVEALPRVGAYMVHSAKLKRLGVPIFTGHTIANVMGAGHVEGAKIVAIDDKWQPISGSEKTFELDTIGLAVGLSPSIEILSQAGAKQAFIPELGGYINLHNHNLETSLPGVFVAGDIAGIEEASSAMMEGRIAGLSAAERIIGANKELQKERQHNHQELAGLREGPFGEKIRQGTKKLYLEAEKHGLC